MGNINLSFTTFNSSTSGNTLNIARWFASLAGNLDLFSIVLVIVLAGKCVDIIGKEFVFYHIFSDPVYDPEKHHSE